LRPGRLICCLAGEADDVPSLGLRSLVAERGDLLPDPADDAVRNRGHQVEGLPGEQGDRARKEHEEENGADDADAAQSHHGVHEGREKGSYQGARCLQDEDGQEHRDHEQRGTQQRAEEQHVAHAAVLSGKPLALGHYMSDKSDGNCDDGFQCDHKQADDLLTLNLKSDINYIYSLTILDSGANMKPSEILRQKRSMLKALMDEFEPFGIYNLRVFGSVARGEDTEQSDIDFVVDIQIGTNGREPGLMYSEFYYKLTTVFDVPVHLVSFRACSKAMKETISIESVPYYKI